MPLALRLLQRSSELFDADANLAIVEGGKTQQQPANIGVPQREAVGPHRLDIVSACGLLSLPRSHSDLMRIWRSSKAAKPNSSPRTSEFPSVKRWAPIVSTS